MAGFILKFLAITGCYPKDFLTPFIMMLIVMLHPGGSIRAEFLGVGFIEGSEEFEDSIC